MEKFKHIFTPITIRNMKVKNRIVMLPMGSNFAMPDGSISDGHINYYRMRAKGGTGLILVENVAVSYPMGSNGTTQLRLDKDCYIPRLYELCETVHAYGSCIGVQINHAGAAAQSKWIGAQPVSSSDCPLREESERPRTLKTEEIYQIIKEYAQAALRAKKAGFDCVEIHAGHSYLPVQFLSPLLNHRTDEFGGTAENRCRFVKLIVQEIRKVVGEQYPIFIRISADEFLPGGNTLEDTLENLKYFIDEVDVIDVSAGLKDSGDRQIDLAYYPDGWRSYMAEKIRGRYKKPVITMGNIRDPGIAEEILEKGEADFIGIGRGLIADPNWVNKVRTGHMEDIRKCISCNVGCVGNRAGASRPIRCSLNPSVCQEENHIQKFPMSSCKVVVIGAGVSGLEAACTAAEVGCKVILLEKRNCIGGLVHEISFLPEKKRMSDCINYFKHRTQKLKNLHIYTNVNLTMEKIKHFYPDLIVNATGSIPFIPPVKGMERINCKGGKIKSVIEMIHNINSYGDVARKKVAVIGGGAVGLDVMEYFALRDADVTVIEMKDKIGADLDPVSRTGIKNIIKNKNVKVRTNTSLDEIREDEFILKNAGDLFAESFDYGFICAGMRANTELLSQLEKTFGEKIPVLNIGDSVRARRIIDGIAEGRNILLTLEAMGVIERV